MVRIVTHLQPLAVLSFNPFIILTFFTLQFFQGHSQFQNYNDIILNIQYLILNMVIQNRINTQIILISFICFYLAFASQKPIQFNPQKLQQAIKNNDFTLVYFYSSTCQYCQQFTPKFDQLAKINNIHGLSFGKIDGPSYTAITQKYDIYSYPSVVLFWKNIDAPIFFYKQREVAALLEFLKSTTAVLNRRIAKSQLQRLSQSEKQNSIIYYGPPQSFQLNSTTVLSIIQFYHTFYVFPANVTKPYLLIRNREYFNFQFQELKKALRTEFAQLHSIDEEAWVRVNLKKQIGLLYVNANRGRATDEHNKLIDLMKKLARQMPQYIFMYIDPSQDQYKEAIDALGVENQNNVYGLHQRYSVKFIASKPYTEQSIRQFMTKVVNLSAPIYKRSQKTTHKQKLTYENFDEKITNDPRDIVLFLYKEEDRIHAKFMDLFKYLTLKLKDNKNLSFLRCNLSKNEVYAKLQMDIKITPMIVFYQHRVKDKPITYTSSLISAENVIQFIMQNTTFDWEDQWGQL